METNRLPTPAEKMIHLTKLIDHYTGLNKMYPTPRIAVWEDELNTLKKAMES